MIRKPNIFLIAITTWSLMATVQGSPIQPNHNETPIVIKAKEMLSYMNESANPCDDFHNFACGNWPAIHPVTEDGKETNVLRMAHKRWRDKTMQILVMDNKYDTDVERKAKEFYASCLGMATGKLYNDKLLDLIREFGHMPAVEGSEWQEADFDWLTTVAEINYNYGIQIIMGYVIAPDPEDSSVKRVRIRHPIIKKSTFTDATKLKKYKTYIKEKLKKYLNLEKALAKQTAREIVDFEGAMIAGSSDDPLTDELYFSTSARKLQKKYSPHLDIKKYLKISLGSVPGGDIFESFPEYQENLIKLMQTTPKKVVANYIFYKLISSFLPPSFDDDSQRQDKCYQSTKHYFAHVLDNMTYKQYDFRAAEQDVMSIFQDLQTFFDSALASETYYSWISKKTRKRAVEKLRAMKIKINTYEDVNYAEEYSKFSVNKYDYVANLKSGHAQEAIKYRADLYSRINSYHRMAQFSPSYVVQQNIIAIPLATLQRYFFIEQDLPIAYNLGQMGFLLAHEILHSLDDTGRQVDVRGNVDQWWDRHSLNNFDNRTNCFINQTQTFTHNGKHLPKRQMQGENIADNGGIRLAFEVYKMWYDSALLAQSERDAEMLPGLRYKDKQLFFLSYAQIWCFDMTKDSMDRTILTDVHLPMHLRVRGPLANYEEFALAFNCPRGSRMNPVHKCRIY